MENKELEQAAESLEFEQGVAVDSDGQLHIEVELPDNSQDMGQVDATSVEENVTPTDSPATEVDTLKAQVAKYEQELQLKNQILDMARGELEKRMASQPVEDVEDLLETFADKEKGLKFLDDRVNKNIDNLVNQKLGTLSQIVTQLVIAKAQDEFRSKHPEAFDNGFLRKEIFDLMKPYTDRGVSWDEAYKPFKARYTASGKAAVAIQKANKLKNTNNIGQTSGQVSVAEKKVESIADAWKNAELQSVLKK